MVWHESSARVSRVSISVVTPCRPITRFGRDSPLSLIHRDHITSHLIWPRLVAPSRLASSSHPEGLPCLPSSNRLAASPVAHRSVMSDSVDMLESIRGNTSTTEDEIREDNVEERQRIMPRKKKKLVSNVWDSFQQIEIDGATKAVCNFCQKELRGDPKTNGTSSLRYHASHLP
uniref:BED-type domain-containing protein n=1 Tax=Kalanchoe fedtschenkoi TaxID=63787 RepID=A0A7N1A7J3_KALFE